MESCPDDPVMLDLAAAFAGLKHSLIRTVDIKIDCEFAACKTSGLKASILYSAGSLMFRVEGWVKLKCNLA